MRRDLSRLESEEHDLLVIGAGIQGACIAWDAALRGLRVAVVERDDFGAATSANSLRIIHGGLRYLARGDFPRMWESIRERSALLRIAPGLVEPLPVLIPTGPPGVPSRLALRAALALTHVFSPRRNRDLPPARRIPAGRLLSRRECLELLPALETAPVTGGALWYDARMTRPERLTLAFVLSAAARGAIAANYAEADAFDVARGAVRAVEV
ncbi:MAG TPA: FAD-dependent oxidoreductase, partial [Gemmatimonadales bacterium]